MKAGLAALMGHHSHKKSGNNIMIKAKHIYYSNQVIYEDSEEQDSENEFYKFLDMDDRQEMTQELKEAERHKTDIMELVQMGINNAMSGAKDPNQLEEDSSVDEFL